MLVASPQEQMSTRKKREEEVRDTCPESELASGGFAVDGLYCSRTEVVKVKVDLEDVVEVGRLRQACQCLCHWY
jgi:hypothetical protein